MESGVKEFKSVKESMTSPLAKRLFSIKGVILVFFGSDFITVQKEASSSWSVLKPDVFAAITDFFLSGDPIIAKMGLNQNEIDSTTILPEDDEVVAAIKEILETRIRPAVQDDGGDIEYRGFNHDSGIVSLKLMGACSGCPSSTSTLKGGIENMLGHYIPEVKKVVEVIDEMEEKNVEAFNKLESRLSN